MELRYLTLDEVPVMASLDMNDFAGLAYLVSQSKTQLNYLISDLKGLDLNQTHKDFLETKRSSLLDECLSIEDIIYGFYRKIDQIGVYYNKLKNGEITELHSCPIMNSFDDEVKRPLFEISSRLDTMEKTIKNLANFN